MPIRQRGSLAKNWITCARLSDRRTTTSPVLLIACTWKMFLARSRPTVVISIVVAPRSCCVTAPPWRCAAGSGSHPPPLLLGCFAANRPLVLARRSAVSDPNPTFRVIGARSYSLVVRAGEDGFGYG